METNSESFKIFIAGGYGIVGSNIAKLVRKYYPQSHILIAGRTPDKGQSLVNELGNASTVMLNLKDDQVPEEIKNSDIST